MAASKKKAKAPAKKKTARKKTKKPKRKARPKSKELFYNQTDMAYALGVTVQAFRRWNLKPAKRRDRKAFYDVREVFAHRLGMLKDTNPKLRDLRVRHESAKAERAEIELEAIKGELLPYAAVAAAWGDMIANCRAKILNLPTKIAMVTAKMSKPAAIEKKARKLCYDALNELRDYEPKAYRIDSKARASKLTNFSSTN